MSSPAKAKVTFRQDRSNSRKIYLNGNEVGSMFKNQAGNWITYIEKWDRFPNDSLQAAKDEAKYIILRLVEKGILTP